MKAKIRDRLKRLAKRDQQLITVKIALNRAGFDYKLARYIDHDEDESSTTKGVTLFIELRSEILVSYDLLCKLSEIVLSTKIDFVPMVPAQQWSEYTWDSESPAVLVIKECPFFS